MPWAAAALPWISAGVGAMGAVKSFTGALQQQAGYDAAAQDALKIGDINAARVRTQYQELGAQQGAGYGHAGVTLEGTPTDVIGDTAFKGEQAAQYETYLAYVKARGLTDTGQAIGQYAQSALISGLAGSASSIAGTSWFKNMTAAPTGTSGLSSYATAVIPKVASV